MIYLEAPNYLPTSVSSYRWFMPRSIFLAGSITGASNWQQEATRALLPYLNVFNPRRENFNTTDKEAEREQITWEFRHLDLAPLTLFYFAPETLAPITLLEYGKQLVKSQQPTFQSSFRRTFVCIHPDYKRKNDVLIQTELVNPKLLDRFFPDLPSMYEAVIKESLDL